MANGRSSLDALVHEYADTRARIRLLERKTNSSVQSIPSWAANMDSVLDHVMFGLKLLRDEPLAWTDVEEHFTEARRCLREAEPCACHAIALIQLDELRRKIDSVGFFGGKGLARDFEMKAQNFYHQGEAARKGHNPLTSIESFLKCIDACTTGIQKIAWPEPRAPLFLLLKVLGLFLGGGLTVWLLSKLFPNI